MSFSSLSNQLMYSMQMTEAIDDSTQLAITVPVCTPRLLDQSVASLIQIGFPIHDQWLPWFKEDPHHEWCALNEQEMNQVWSENSSMEDDHHAQWPRLLRSHSDRLLWSFHCPTVLSHAPKLDSLSCAVVHLEQNQHAIFVPMVLPQSQTKLWSVQL